MAGEIGVYSNGDPRKDEYVIFTLWYRRDGEPLTYLKTMIRSADAEAFGNWREYVAWRFGRELPQIGLPVCYHKAMLAIDMYFFEYWIF